MKAGDALLAALVVLIISATLMECTALPAGHVPAPEREDEAVAAYLGA